MIVTSLKRSYPNLLDDVRRGTAQWIDHVLEGITRGDWPRMKAATLDGYLDYVVGTYDGMIVSAFVVERVEPQPNGTVKFAGPSPWEDKTFEKLWDQKHRSNSAEDPAEWLIGCPMPGGPWRQGESRGTRRYLLEDYLVDHPELRGRRDEDFGGRMASNLVDYLATGKAIATEDYPVLASTSVANAAAPDTGVTVVRQPGGTVVITIPTGTRAQLLIEPEGGTRGGV